MSWADKSGGLDLNESEAKRGDDTRRKRCGRVCVAITAMPRTASPELEAPNISVHLQLRLSPGTSIVK